MTKSTSVASPLGCRQLATLLGGCFTFDDAERLAETFETLRDLARHQGFDAATSECDHVLAWLRVALPTLQG